MIEDTGNSSLGRVEDLKRCPLCDVVIMVVFDPYDPDLKEAVHGLFSRHLREVHMHTQEDVGLIECLCERHYIAQAEPGIYYSTLTTLGEWAAKALIVKSEKENLE